MAQHSDAVFEESYISFCLQWVNPATRWQHHDSLRREWASMSFMQQQDTLPQIEQLQDALQARGYHERAIVRLQDQLTRLPPDSNEDRLNLLDQMDDEVNRSIGQSSRLLAMIDVLQTDFADLREWSHPLHLFTQAIGSWQVAVQNMIIQTKEDSKRSRAELHSLKRNTPGRKVEYIDMQRVHSLETQAIHEASRLPTIPNPSIPPIFQHAWNNRSLDCRWECRILKENIGGINAGIDLMYGINEHGTIITRAVQKRLDPANPPVDPREWCGDLEYGYSEPILKEYATQVVAAEAQGARFVLRPLREPVNWGGNDWRLYLEYAPHGDLDAVVNAHFGTGTQVPEAFLWMLFQSLIETALILKNGVLSGKSPDIWREIVHRDWKPANVVLALSESGHFPQYPRPRVADFGFAIFTDENDPLNPDYWIGDGTPGYFPPEGTSYIDPEMDKPVDDWKMLSPCNVWGIGMIMYTLMTQRVIDNETQPEYAVPIRSRNDDNAVLEDLDQMEDMFNREIGIQNLEPQFLQPQDNINITTLTTTAPTTPSLDPELFGYKLSGHITGTYDPNLCDTVQNCLNFHPDDRPTVEQLKYFIDETFRLNPTLGLLNSGGSSECAHELLSRPERERYRIGIVWGAVGDNSEDSKDSEEEEEKKDLDHEIDKY
ncbi:hypothetical protein DOTSEDRAFT_22025 [Dothistroma septosporum NZE10]|uniref:Protein kinase domain-containing protein n=1 Tax=Dothistroma septosporum (strain NZE10 / CBS 128990) TaxID=675120 RepID=N1PR28_DOTSN|nr:hypothetical protein DOTSEDRAFT_22025 [Dothistroma septosporum NZE10]